MGSARPNFARRWGSSGKVLYAVFFNDQDPSVPIPTPRGQQPQDCFHATEILSLFFEDLQMQLSSSDADAPDADGYRMNACDFIMTTPPTSVRHYPLLRGAGKYNLRSPPHLLT